MAKGARSNSQKKLRTQRRESVVKQTVWLAAADEKRQQALQNCLNAEPVPVESASKPQEESGAAAADALMSDDGKAAGSGSGAGIYISKKKKLAKLSKGGKVKKVSIHGRNQFHKKKRKGT